MSHQVFANEDENLIKLAGQTIAVSSVNPAQVLAPSQDVVKLHALLVQDGRFAVTDDSLELVCLQAGRYRIEAILVLNSTHLLLDIDPELALYLTSDAHGSILGSSRKYTPVGDDGLWLTANLSCVMDLPLGDRLELSVMITEEAEVIGRMQNPEVSTRVTITPL